MLVWWFGTFFIFPCIGNVIIPTDEVIFFRGVGIPPTRICIDRKPIEKRAKWETWNILKPLVDLSWGYIWEICP